MLHCRGGGLRQGDCLRPMFFLLAMELVHNFFKRAQRMGLLAMLNRNCEAFRMSLYANDL
jgi:hypothetical protein